MTQPDTNQPVVTSTTSDRDAALAAAASNIVEGKVDTLPEWAQNIIKDARGEAANYRVKLRETETALSKAGTPEEVTKELETLRSTNAELDRRLLVTSVAAKHGLPADLAALLQGDTEAALETHATALAKYAPKTEVPPVVDPNDLSGGLDPSGSGEVFDAVAVAAEARRTRY